MIRSRCNPKAQWRKLRRFAQLLFLAAPLLLDASATGRAATSAPDATGGRQSFPVTASPFEEPLVRTASTTRSEDAALTRAITAYARQGVVDDFHPFDRFLATHAKSGWRVALLTDLGLANYHYGHFSKAIAAWEQAWREGRNATEPHAKALVDRALGELARMHARLGHADRLAALLDEVGERPVSGPATEALAGAKEGLWVMRNEPGIAYLCGPMALKNLLLAQGVPVERLAFLDAYRSGPQGVSLTEVARLAGEAGLPFRLVHRDAGEPVPVPSIVHWKVGHFAAILGEADGRFRILDPTFGEEELWVTRRALDAESSGYFLAPAESVARGWRTVDAAEAGAVRGMGFPQGKDTAKGIGQGNVTAHRAVCTAGMCGYNILEMLVSLTLSDTPVGYTPPKGPPVKVTLTYNQREANQPANFSFFNISPKWTLNFLSYIQDDPTNPGANVSRYAASGGSIPYLGFNKATNAFTSETSDAAVLLRGTDPAISYERRLSDGSRELYARSDGAARFPRRVFLSELIDPAGNKVTLNYDGQLRLTSLTDATGRSTIFAYGLANAPLLITEITDPFGRSAKLAYDDKGRLVGITDVMGMTSSFTYDASSLVNSLTTPYGTTTFAFGETPNSRFVEVTDPLDNKEREEWIQPSPGIPAADPAVTIPKGIVQPFNGFLNGRNSFYWDKNAFAVAHGDYSKARITHFAHLATNTNVEANTIESIKYPLESRIWLNYPDQKGAHLTGGLDKPNRIGRVLDDGTTQLRQITYNSLGKPTDVIDPAGRETLIEYDQNQIDALRVLQATPTGKALLAAFTYNKQHQPLTYVDAARGTTSYAYNDAGQLVQVTDPLGNTTKYQYNELGQLTAIIDANGKTATSVSYDALGRVAVRTDSEGYRAGFDYDAFDRVTEERFPDGTTRQYTYDKLDLAAVKDRQGRVTRFDHDALRNLIAVTDPLGRVTRYAYYENGKLKSVTDPNGNVTSFEIDLESRVTARRYADGNKSTNTYESTTSRLKSTTDPLGQVKQLSYTPDDRLAGIDYAKAVNPTPSVRLIYDPSFPRLSSMAHGEGTTVFQYGPVGAPGALLLLSETGPRFNDAVFYRYDALGRVVARDVDTSAESFAYDALGRLTAHTSALGAFALSYLGETRQLAGRHLAGGGFGTDWSYDAKEHDRLAAIASAGARSYQFTATPEDLITRIVETATGGAAPQSWTYAHDDADRLVQGESSGGVRYGYGYDAGDNLTALPGPGGSIQANYNKLDQLTGIAGRSFRYDADGNLTDDGERSYRWDAENRLIGITSKSDPVKQVTFRYDGMGRRLAAVTSTGGTAIETRYLWCGTKLCHARDAEDAVMRRYFDEGEMIVAAGTPLFYAEDQLGSVRDVVAPDGSRAASYDYDPFGNATQSSGRVATDFRYAGMFFESESGLYLTLHRTYDPRTGRWLSRDPLEDEGSANPYVYAASNPIQRIDPEGLQSFPSFGQAPAPQGMSQPDCSDGGSGPAAGRASPATGTSFGAGQFGSQPQLTDATQSTVCIAAIICGLFTIGVAIGPTASPPIDTRPPPGASTVLPIE